MSTASISSDADKKMTTPTCLDDFLKLGKYTLLICVLCEMIILLQAGNLFFMVFGGASPSISRCANLHFDTSLNKVDMCKMYHNGTCDPVIEYQFESVNVEWRHYCEDGKSIKDSTSYQMIGYMMGTLVFGQVSDVYGRKWPMFVCLLMTGILGVATAFSPNLIVFTILRTLLSFFNSGHICIVMVYMCEKFPKKHRMWLNFVLSWSPNLILVTVIAYLCGNWKVFTVVLNTLGFTAAALLLFANESVYWLVRKGRMDEAEQIMYKITAFDGSICDKLALSEVIEHERKQFEKVHSNGNYSFPHLFCTWQLMSFTLTMVFSYFSVSLINYGIMFNMETLSGSMYFNTMIVGVVRFALNILSAIAEFNFSRIGRRISHFFFASYTLISIMVILGVQFSGNMADWAHYTRYIIITAGSVICQIYVINGVTTSEIFPTPIRNIAYSIMQLSGSLGSIFAPQLFLLNSIDVSAPFFVMLALLIGESVCFFFFIPESKGRPMAETMPPKEKRIFGRGRIIPLVEEKC